MFEAAGRHMSFTAAADELCVTQSAVSRGIRHLEEHLGATLFTRKARGLDFTEEGHTLWLDTRVALDVIEKATLRILRERDSQILTVNALPTFAVKWLMPRLNDFHQRHADIEVRLTTSIRPLDFRHGDTDIGIRVGQPPSKEKAVHSPRIDLCMSDYLEGIDTEYMFPDEIVPVAAPSLLSKKNISSPAELKQFPLLHNATRKNAWEDWFASQNETAPTSTDHLYFGHFFLVIQAALQGEGIAVVPRILIEDDLAAGRLVVALDKPVMSAGAYYLLCKQEHANLYKVRTFRDWIRQTCEADQLKPQ